MPSSKISLEIIQKELSLGYSQREIAQRHGVTQGAVSHKLILAGSKTRQTRLRTSSTIKKEILLGDGVRSWLENSKPVNLSLSAHAHNVICKLLSANEFCPNCASKEHARDGRDADNMQRYECKTCGKKYRWFI